MSSNTSSTIEFASIPEQLILGDSVFPSIALKTPELTSLSDSCDWVRSHIAEIELALKSTGAVLFRGFPIDSAQGFDAFSAAFGYSTFTYQESLSNAVRINFTERVFTANEAPKEVEIYLHHEMAQTPISPDKLFFFCKSAAEHGGATPICRSDKLFAQLQTDHPDLAQQFEEKGLKYTTNMPSADDHASGQGRSWMSTLSVETRQQAETKLAELGYSWQWLSDGGLRAITPVLPAVVRTDNGTEVFYNQLVAAYMGWTGVKENPASAITFGDSTEIPVEALELIVELTHQFTFDLAWQDGDVVLIDNKMTMHGRRPYAGERKREVLVALTT